MEAAKVDDRLDAVLADDFGHQRLVAALADDQAARRFANRPVKAGRKIVEHDNALAGIGQRVHHVAADIAGSAGDQDRHVGRPVCCRAGLHGFDEYRVMSGFAVLSDAALVVSARRVGSRNVIGVIDFDHAAMMAEAADRLVARPAREFGLCLEWLAASGLSGAQCHGLVGPNIPMVGVPDAAATCREPGIVGDRGMSRPPAPEWPRAGRCR